MFNRKLLALAIISSAGLLGGCGSLGGQKDFSCPGMPDGITCADPITVYEHSNDMQDLEKLRKTQEDMKAQKAHADKGNSGDIDVINTEDDWQADNHASDTAASEKKEVDAPSLYIQDDAQPGELVKVTAARNGKKTSTVYQSYINQKQLIADPGSPMPILQPAEVARIWIAPWTDESQDLHWPGFVFTEITPRRWSFGEGAVGAIRPTLPVLIDNGHRARLNARRKNARRRYETARRTPATNYAQRQAATGQPQGTAPIPRTPPPPPGRNTFTPTATNVPPALPPE